MAIKLKDFFNSRFRNVNCGTLKIFKICHESARKLFAYNYLKILEIQIMKSFKEKSNIA